MGVLALKSDVSYYLDEYTNKINEATQQIKSNYIYIGFLLNELANSENFSHEPYTIAEYAENEFGFSKSLTYSMMKVSERFCHGMFLSDRFKNYGYSQLVELLSVSDSDLVEFNSDMSVREIKEKKRELKEKYVSRVSFQTSGKENLIEKDINEYDLLAHSEHVYASVTYFKIREDEDVEMMNTFFDVDVKKGQSFRVVFYDASTKETE